MLEQQQIHEEGPKQYVPTAYENNNAALALTPHAQALVAAYIAQVEAEQQNATRTRLEELLAAHLELDGEPEQAAHSAIQQIENERLASEQQQATAKQQAFGQRKRTRSAKQSARPATLTALKLFGAGSLAMIGFFAGLNVWMLHGDHSSTAYQLTDYMALAIVLGLPTLLGITVGARAKHRPTMGTFSAIGLLIPLMSFVGASAFTALPSSAGWGQNFCDLAAILALFWLPIGVTAAGVTGWGRDTLRRKRREDARTGAVRAES